MADVTDLHANALARFRLSHDRVPLPRRRLSDKVLIVFHHACDAEDLEAADHLLRLLEIMVTTRPKPGTPERRINLQTLVDAHERLLALRAANKP